MARFGRAYPVHRVIGKRPIPVEYLATGPGGASVSSPITYTDVIPSGANCTLIWAGDYGTPNPPTVSASGGASAATLLASVEATVETTDFLYLYCFSVFSPPTGSQTISFTTTSSGFVGGVVNAVHYANVAAIGTPITTGLQTGQPSMSVSSSGDLRYRYANAFTYGSGTVGQSFSGYNQNQLYVKATASGSNRPILIGDGQGNGSTLTFSSNRDSTTFNWGGIIVPLIPVT